MQTEIEAKFPDIDTEQLRKLLREVGAMCVQPERLMKRINFNGPTGDNAWLRVRDEGDRVTMTYKRTFERTLHGTKEIEVIVDDFARAVELLEAMGLSGKALQETKRETWEWKDCSLTIDTWPWIPSFMEIEGPTEEVVREVAAALGFDWNDALFGSVENVYQRHYAITEEEFDACPSIAFGPVPDWLERVKR